MSALPISMRKFKEVLRLKYEAGLSQRQIRPHSRSKGFAQSGPHSVGVSAADQGLFPGNPTGGEKAG